MTEESPACPVCSHVPLKELRKLNAAIVEGSTTLAILAQQFKLDLDALAGHARACVDLAAVDGFEQLTETTRRLASLSKKLEDDVNAEAYKEFDPEGGVDGRAVIQNYLATLRETRETVLALRRLQSVDDAVVGLTRNVVAPLVSSATMVCIEELRRLRETLFTSVPAAQHNRVKEAIDESLERIGSRLKAESMQDLREKVEAVLQTKAK